MRKVALLAGVLAAWIGVATPARAALEFTPAAGYAVSEVWAGGGGSHFAVAGADCYIYGSEQVAADQWQSVVRRYDGAATTEIARSPAYATGAYSPDAVTVVGGDVYWANVQSHAAGAAASVYKTSFDGGTWTTTTVLDESAGINVYSLSTNGDRVFGVGLGAGGGNVAFCLDADDSYNVFAELSADGCGGSGFDPSGNFFAGAWSVGGDWASHMYEYSAQQVTERLDGTQAIPYAASDAVGDHVVPGNASAVMESDGTRLFGTELNATYTGTDPFAYDLAGSGATSLGTLAGADTTVCTDTFWRDGEILFMAKDSWTTGQESVIYRLVPEPASLWLLACGAALLMRGDRIRRAVRNGASDLGASR